MIILIVYLVIHASDIIIFLKKKKEWIILYFHGQTLLKIISLLLSVLVDVVIVLTIYGFSYNASTKRGTTGHAMQG